MGWRCAGWNIRRGKEKEISLRIEAREEDGVLEQSKSRNAWLQKCFAF